MKIDVHNPAQMLSHVLLGSREVVDKVTNTDQFLNDGTVTATVFMNGVEVPAEALESVLKKLFDQVEEHYREQYQADAFDERVEEKARQLLKEHADNALEKLGTLTNLLDDSENLLTPYWERNKQ